MNIIGTDFLDGIYLINHSKSSYLAIYKNIPWFDYILQKKLNKKEFFVLV
jgi:hypothetical protein